MKVLEVNQATKYESIPVFEDATILGLEPGNMEI